MKAKLLIAPCKRRPIRKNYTSPGEISIWFNDGQMAKSFIMAAIKRFSKKDDSIIEVNYTDLTKRVRILFDQFDEAKQARFKNWLSGYAYAKGLKFPILDMYHQPTLTFDET